MSTCLEPTFQPPALMCSAFPSHHLPIFLLRCPLPHLPATLPSITVFCKLLSHAICPKNFSFLLFTILKSSSFLIKQTLCTSLLVTYLVWGILKIFLVHLFSSCNLLLYSSREHPRFASVGGHQEDNLPLEPSSEL